MKIWERYRNFLLNGEWHIHTNYTDGVNSIDEVCKTADRLKIPLIAFTEHVRNNLDYDFNEFLRDIRKARKKYHSMIILSGIEAKILDNGSIDVSPEIISKIDYPIVAFHSFPKDYTNLEYSLKKAIKIKEINTWAHPEPIIAHFIKNHIINLLPFFKKEKILLEKNQKYHITNMDINLFAQKNKIFVVNGNDIHSCQDLENIYEGNH